MPRPGFTDAMSATEAAVNKATSSVDKVIIAARRIHDSSDLPEAFLVVKKWLHPVYDCLQSMAGRFKTHCDEGFCISARGWADGATSQATDLRQIYNETLREDGNALSERYRRAVSLTSSRKPVEDIMDDLLSNVLSIARGLPLDNERIEKIRDALGEVGVVQRSLFIEESSGGTFINSGSGVQPIHNGRGNINMTTGSGISVPGGTIHHIHSPTESDRGHP